MAWEEPYLSLLRAGHVLCYQPTLPQLFPTRKIIVTFVTAKIRTGRWKRDSTQPGIITISARSSDAKLYVK
jgi:hypothetical protein